jgi:hypothetical protein
MSLPRALRRAVLLALTLLLLVPLAAAPASAAPVAPAQPSPACPEGSTPDARWVQFTYQAILRRCADPAGLAHWTAKLAGGASRASVSDAIDMSTENLGKNNVDPLYRFTLGRAPTAAERAAGIADLRARHANDHLTARLMASDEGYAREGVGATPLERDTAWITWAYNRILDRAPDPLGLRNYLGYFASTGSTAAQRFKVAMGLERSRSNALSWTRAAMAEALGRQPDPTGVAFWSQWLTGPRGRWQTFRMWTLLLASNEAYRRAQTL